VVTSGPAPGLTARFGRLVVAAGGLTLTLGLGLLALAVSEVGTTGSLMALVPGSCWPARASASASRR
jgi:hypothetical protein